MTYILNTACSDDSSPNKAVMPRLSIHIIDIEGLWIKSYLSSHPPSQVGSHLPMFTEKPVFCELI